jgi:hypothetical protein
MNKTKKTSVVFLIILLLVSTYNFSISMEGEQHYEYGGAAGDKSSFFYEKTLTAKQTYTISIQISSTDDFTAKIWGNISILIDQIVKSNFIVNKTDIKENDDPIAYVESCTILKFEIKEQGFLTIKGSITEGERWVIIVYQNLPENPEIIYWTWLCLLAFSGLVLIEIFRRELSNKKKTNNNQIQ